MFSVSTRVPDHICGALGCSTDSLDEDLVVIDHPKHGERIVCPDCATGYEVVDDV